MNCIQLNSLPDVIADYFLSPFHG